MGHLISRRWMDPFVFILAVRIRSVLLHGKHYSALGCVDWCQVSTGGRDPGAAMQKERWPTSGLDRVGMRVQFNEMISKPFPANFRSRKLETSDLPTDHKKGKRPVWLQASEKVVFSHSFTTSLRITQNVEFSKSHNFDKAIAFQHCGHRTNLQPAVFFNQFGKNTSVLAVKQWHLDVLSKNIFLKEIPQQTKQLQNNDTCTIFTCQAISLPWWNGEWDTEREGTGIDYNVLQFSFAMRLSTDSFVQSSG